MATGYGVCVYILYGQRAISLWATGFHRRTSPNPNGGRAEIVRWLHNYRVFLGIRVPNAFLIEMTPKTKGQR